MTPREEADVILAVDVGGTGLSGGIVDPDGTLLASHTVATDRLGRGEGILSNLHGGCEWPRMLLWQPRVREGLRFRPGSGGAGA